MQHPEFSCVAIGLCGWYSKVMLQERLGTRIADLRRERKLTQVQLAKAIGCSVEFISLVERGINAPSVAGLERFAQVLRVDVVELFTFKARKRARRAVRKRGTKTSR